MGRTIPLHAALAAALLLCPMAVHAGDEVVDDCSDDTQLRSKLESIQDSPGGTLTFACGTQPVTIVLTADLPAIGTPTTIDGGGTVTLSGADERQIVAVQFGGQLTLRRLVLTNGFQVSANGGAVANGGTLILDDVQILRSSAATFSGGAIWSAPLSRLEVRNSTLAFNDGANAGAIFADDGAQVAITGSVLHDNEATRTTDGWGGAILLWERAKVTIDGGELYGNAAIAGGAIATVFPTASLSVRGTLIRDNHATSRSGAIHVGGLGAGSRATAELSGVTLADNSSETGGGITCASNHPTIRSDLRLVDSTLSNNTATRFDGGGIRGLRCHLVLESVTVSDGSAAGAGGGLDLVQTEAELTNVTVSGNEAASGGGLGLHSATATLTNVTIARNSVTGALTPNAGGLRTDRGTVTLRNVALDDNAGGNCLFQESGVSQAFDVSSDGTCGIGGGRDAVALLLDPLADNGGPTKTHLPRPGSPLIDAGTADGCPATDQRGTTRPLGTTCDVGAVEVPGGATTTTTLPAGACTPACATADPCRPQACVGGACVAQEPAGLAGASCACQRSLPDACAGAAIPPKIEKTADKACTLLAGAASASGGRQRRKLTKAGRKWQAAARLLSKKPARRALTADCATALAADYEDAGNRAALVLQTGG